MIRQLGPKMKDKLAALATAEGQVERLYAEWARLSELDSYGS